MKTLSSAGTPSEHVEMLSFAVFSGEFGTGFFKAVIKYFEVSLDNVTNIAQERSSSLLAIFRIICEDTEQWDGLASHRSGRGGTGFRSHFVATDIGEADGLENVDAINNPTDLRFPVDGLQNAARSGRSDDVVGDALDLHFRPREAGVFAADVELNAV